MERDRADVTVVWVHISALHNDPLYTAYLKTSQGNLTDLTSAQYTILAISWRYATHFFFGVYLFQQNLLSKNVIQNDKSFRTIKSFARQTQLLLVTVLACPGHARYIC